MSEFESEDEILDRIEAALRKIAGRTQISSPAPSFNRAAAAQALDEVIDRLRTGLNAPPPAEEE